MKDNLLTEENKIFLNELAKLDHRFVGVDDGHSCIKVYVGISGDLSEPIQFKMFSRAKIGVANMGDDDTINRELVVVDGDTYTVNENIPDFESTQNDNYPLSKLNKALVYQGLRKADVGRSNVVIATGLPVSKFYTSGMQKMMNKDLLLKKKNHLMGMSDVYNKFDHSREIPQIKVIDHKVFCEANAAYYDVLLNDLGEITELAESYELFEYGAAVIDIGGRTTDCVVINPGGGSLNSNRSGTVNLGILDLLEELRNDLKARHNWSFISETSLNKAMLTGHYGAGANKVDVTDLVQAHKERLFKRLESFIDSTIGDASDVPAIILVGGGSYILGETIKKKYKNLIIPEEQEFSNARGFYKILVHHARN